MNIISCLEEDMNSYLWEEQMLKRMLFIGIGILFLTYVGTYIYLDKWGSDSKAGANATHAEQEEAKLELEQSFEAITPKEDMPKYESMSEKELLNEVHGMTHQKVEADQKWGSSEITRDKIETMFTVVSEKSFKDGELKSILLSILEPWTKGDFSDAVEEHNLIWNYKDGNIGEAKRLLTPVEEQEYVEKHFR